MNSRSARGTVVTLLLAAALPSPEAAPLRHAGNSLDGLTLAAGENGAAPGVFIVQLNGEGASVAAERERRKLGLAVAGKPRADRENPAVKTRARSLARQQERVLAKAGRNLSMLYSYRYAMNGFAARMSPEQADKLSSLPEVAGVWPDTVRPLATNSSPTFLRLFDGETGLRGARGLDGDGIVVGVIDSGIAPEHPSFADSREADQPSLCESSFGDTWLGRWLCRRFRNRPDVQLFDPPEGWNGECIAGERFAATDCNNKLIGARFFIEGARNTGPIDAGEIDSARDADGHGTHIASTAAGNRVQASLMGNEVATIQGMAPRARIAVYKACWLRPGDTRASCNTSDLAQAIDAAVADGVDVINYSVGNTRATVTEPDDVALLAATKAGVFTAVAAGNTGPGLRTIGSPASSPWVTTVAASSREGRRFEEAIEVLSPASLAGRYASREASFTPPLSETGTVETALILVDDGETATDDGGTDGFTYDGCQTVDNAGELDGNVALMSRGGCEFEVKIANAETAGAAAAVVFNNAGGPIVMTGTDGSVDIPAVMIGEADGTQLLDELSGGGTASVRLTDGLFLAEEVDGNIVGNFSSRGPSAGAPDVLKPDVTAPGIEILAAFSPDAANVMQGENFGYLTGTSMATPHVAGVAALLRELHPDWSPAAIRSALMTSAYLENVVDAQGRAANPFDVGGGHIDPNPAADPGLVYDAGDDDYDAFACGLEEPPVAPSRCQELNAAGRSFDPSDFNQPSIAVEKLVSAQTVRRRVTNPGDPAAWQVEIDTPPGVAMAVNPSTLSLGTGESAEFDVSFTVDGSAPLDFWYFGALTWRDSAGGGSGVRSPVAVRPVSLRAPEEVKDAGSSGTLTFPVDFGYSGPYTPRVHGLREPLVIDGFVAADPTKTFSFRNGNGVTAHAIDLAANQAYVRFALFDEFTDGNDDDLDLFVFFCPNGSCQRIGESGEPTSNEEFNLLNPPAGRYIALVHGFEPDPVAGGPGANYQLFAWSFGLVDDAGNMTVDAPGLVAAGSTEIVTVQWSGLTPGIRYLGGISHGTPTGLVGLTVINIDN